MDWSQIFYQDGDGIVRTLVVGVLAYICLVAFLRISGKRTLAKLNAFDLVVTVALGSTLATMLLQESVALAEGVAALLVLVGAQFLVAFLSVRSRSFARAVRSEPTLLVRDGRFCERALKTERITADEAVSAIRANGGVAVSDAWAVVLESDGSLSVVLKDAVPVVGSTIPSLPQ